MNKSLKVVSSVALAGMLAINVLNPTALAKSVDDRYDTKLAGTYKGMAQFVLANKNDYVTYREIANSQKFTNVESFKGAGVPSNDNELVKTGDKFVADGKEYTVVVYGEVNKNADRLTQDDALKILKHFTGSSKMTDEAELEAANVDRTNDRITQDDALQVLKYFTGSTNTLIKGNLPHDDDTTVEDIQYTLVANEGKVINNTDVTAYTDGTNTAINTIKDISIVATPGTGITDQTLKARYLIDGEVVGSATNVNSAFGTNNVTATITVTGATVKAWENGTIVAELFYEDEAGVEHIVGRTNIEKQIIETGNIKTTNVSTERSNSRAGKLTIEAKDIKEAYYKVGSAIAITDFINSDGNLIDGVKEATVSNNKVTKADVTGLTENTINTVSYMIIDSYGNIKIESTIIALENAKQMQTPTIANLDLDSANKFTWEAPTKDVDNSNLSLESEKLEYTVNLIKNNEIVDTKTIVTDTDNLEYLVPSEVGKYKISVKANTTSDGKYTESEIAYSNEVEVSKLNALQNVKIEKTKTTSDNDTLKISWADSNDADYEDGYTFKLYKINAEGEVDSGTNIDESDIVYNDENTEATILFTDLSISNNVVYYIGTEVKPASSQYKKIKSDEAESNKLINPTVSGCNVANVALTTTDAKLTIGNPIVKIANEEVKYLVEFYDLGTKIGENGQPAFTYTANSMSKTYSLTPVKNDNGVATGDYTIDINGLEAGKTYTMKVFAMIDDEKVALANTAESGYTNNADGYIQLKTTGILPTFNGTISKVTADDFELASKDSSKIVISGTNIGLKGVAYDTTAMNLTTNDATIFTRNLAIAEALHDGDKLSINGNSVTITLNSREAMGTLASVNLSDVSLTINENNQISRTITLPTSSSTKAEKLILNGTGSIFTVTSDGAKEIVLNNGVEVKVNANSYIVVAQAEATVNGVKVKSNADTTVTVDGSGNVTVNKLAQTTFDATFNMNTAAKYALTNFELKAIGDTEDRYTISTKVGKIFKKYENSDGKDVYANEADLTEEYLDEALEAGTVITTIEVASDNTVRSQLKQIAGDDVKAYDLIKFLANFNAYNDKNINITTKVNSKEVKLSFVGNQTINPTPAVKNGMAITIAPNTTVTK